MANSKSYTTADKATIQDAWYALARAIESDRTQERRIFDMFAADKKHFGFVATRAHILGYVRQGLNEATPVTVANLAVQRDAIILCYMVGQYLRQSCATLVELTEALDAAIEAERGAQARFIKTL